MAQIYLDPRYLHQHREPLRESSDPSHERSRCFQVFYPDQAGNGGISKPPFKGKSVKVPHSRRGCPLLRNPYQENLSMLSMLIL